MHLVPRIYFSLDKQSTSLSSLSANLSFTRTKLPKWRVGCCLSELQNPESDGNFPYRRHNKDWACFYLNTPPHLDIDNINNENVLLFPATVYVHWKKSMSLQNFCFSFLFIMTSTKVFIRVETFTDLVTLKAEIRRF